jgi:prepilin-type processing-associated H-X9-DG protein/prepilin-type N-terminal cleavage/methylation domain-containing protein
MTPKRHNLAAFSLIELLVVVAVLSLLMAFLLPALSKAKATAQAAHCRRNMRQMGIAMTMYINEFNRYPLACNPAMSTKRQFGLYSVERATTWYDALLPYADDDVMAVNCPVATAVYKLNRVDRLYSQFGCYGYNAFGTGWRFPEKKLGLGRYETTYPPDPVDEVAPANIRVPSDMIAAADASVLANGIISPVSAPKDFWPTKLVSTNAMPSGIHLDGANVLFCDGHVEHIKINRLTYPGDQARRMWNSDYLPHRETW